MFFTLVPKDPVEVTTADVSAFITSQRSLGDHKVVRLCDGASCRLSSVSSMLGTGKKGLLHWEMARTIAFLDSRR